MELNFKEYVEYNTLLEEGAEIILEKNIDPAAIQELADLYEGFWGSAARMAGGLGGSMLGSALGPGGSIAGAMTGSTLAGKASDWLGKKFGRNKAIKIAPLYQQAKQSFGNLVSALSKIKNNPRAEEMLTNGKDILNSLKGMEREVPAIDGPAQPRGFFGRQIDKVSDFARRNPGLMNTLGTGLKIGAGYALGNALHGGHTDVSGHDTGDVVPNTHVPDVTGHHADHPVWSEPHAERDYNYAPGSHTYGPDTDIPGTSTQWSSGKHTWTSDNADSFLGTDNPYVPHHGLPTPHHDIAMDKPALDSPPGGGNPFQIYPKGTPIPHEVPNGPGPDYGNPPVHVPKHIPFGYGEQPHEIRPMGSWGPGRAGLRRSFR